MKIYIEFVLLQDISNFKNISNRTSVPRYERGKECGHQDGAEPLHKKGRPLSRKSKRSALLAI